MKNKKFRLVTSCNREFIIYAIDRLEAVNKLFASVRDAGIVIAINEVL